MQSGANSKKLLAFSQFLGMLTLLWLGLASPLASQVTVNSNSGSGSGIVMPETGVALSSSGADSIFANSSNHRLNISNFGGSAQLVAIWPCLSAGCIPYSSGTNFAETPLTLGSTVGLPLLAGSTAPQWGGASFDLQNFAIFSEMTAATSSVPQLNQLVVLSTANPSTVQNAATSSTTGVEGICIANCTSGATNAQIARAGVASCKFDAATSAGHYVQASTTTAGLCKDVASYPANGAQVLGRVTSNCLANVACPVLLSAAGIVPPSLIVATNKIATFNNTLTLAAATDGLTMTFPGASDTVVTLGAAQTMTNKTLTSPVISTISNTGTLTLPISTDTLVGRLTTDTLQNKTLNTANNTLKFGGTTIPNITTVNNAVGQELWATTSAAQTGNLGPVTLVTSPAQITWYRISFYVEQVLVGSGCTGNTTIQAQVGFQNPNVGAASNIPVDTCSITGNGAANKSAQCGGGNLGQAAGSYVFPVKASTSITYSTIFNAGTGCAANTPTYTITPILEQL